MYNLLLPYRVLFPFDSKWINQVLVIKKTSNENVLLEEKCKNVSNKKISLVTVVDF